MTAARKRAPVPVSYSSSSLEPEAQAEAELNSPPSKRQKLEPTPTRAPTSTQLYGNPNASKFYGVRIGRQPGVYTKYDDVVKQITGFPKGDQRKFSTYEDAAAFVSGEKPPPDSSKPIKYYGVAVGHKPGVYTDYGDVQEQLVKFKGPKFRKFDTLEEAEEFIRTFRGVTSDSSSVPVKEEQIAIKEEDTTKATQMEASPAKKSKKTAKSSTTIQVVYTDGSSRGNGKETALAGVGVYFGPEDPRNVSERLQGDLQTNQRAELTAILRALEIIPMHQSAEIRSDSKYSIQCVTEWYKGWAKNEWTTKLNEPVKNRDLIAKIRANIDERKAKHGCEIQFTWVKAHAKDLGNIAADQLAVAGSRK